MPPVATEAPLTTVSRSANSSFDGPRKSNDRTLGGVFTYTNGTHVETGLPDHRLDQFKNVNKTSSLHSLPNGTPNGSITGLRDRSHSKTGSIQSIGSGGARHLDNSARSPGSSDGLTKLSNVEHAPSEYRNGEQEAEAHSPASKPRSSFTQPAQGDNWPLGPPSAPLNDMPTSSRHNSDILSPHQSQLPPLNRFSSPPGMSAGASQQDRQIGGGGQSLSIDNPRLIHRHTLQVPKPASSYRASREFSFTGGPSEEALSATGRFSPTNDGAAQHRRRRASLGLVRRTTRSMISDSHVDDPAPDEDAIRWSEAVRAKRVSRRKQKEDEDDSRVIVGKKVEEGHVNWVTAYNMLTGIRFTVSRTNAKIDRELTDADFVARHKFSFDITGNELTPSAKYDFKFKDYSPWVFRHLRAIFGLDPADYLMSLTSKYILSELGSPGKSGSFFYFSRDYKYIIKTIHHAEHKLLRKILKEYYNHVVENPNTLISQFYGLHRVKIPYGRKIHFVVMNNLFPPHRDIHQMFDLKGSTIGREFKEELLEKNPRATLKDLNWLRREYHLEFDEKVKRQFVEQMRRDVSLLQKLKIMDYSLLVGIHDLEKGNEEKLREKTLRVFQPGGEKGDDNLDGRMLMRTPSRLEASNRARELRLTLKKEKPVQMGLGQTKMPDEIGIADERRDRLFYSADGGIRATHEDGRPGEEIYYLGIIDCLTHYGFVKRLEHFWKGLSADSKQISPVPPVAYGDRFINFMTGVTMTKEEAARRQVQDHPQQDLDQGQLDGVSDLAAAGIRAQRLGQLQHQEQTGQLRQIPEPRSPAVEKTMNKAQKQADKSEKGRRRGSEEHIPDRVLSTQHDGNGADLQHLPVVEEAGEAGSTGGRSNNSKQDLGEQQRPSEKLENGVNGSQGGIRHVSNSTVNTNVLSNEHELDRESLYRTPEDDIHHSRGGFFDDLPSILQPTEKVEMRQGQDLRIGPELENGTDMSLMRASPKMMAHEDAWMEESYENAEFKRHTT